MKRVWIPLLLAFFGTAIAFPARYSVEPAQASNASYIEAHASEIAILADAQALFAKYGLRPPYTGPVFLKNEPLSDAQAETVLPYILACESGGRDVSELDSNQQNEPRAGPVSGRDVEGARQEQSGIEGTATEAIPAVEMSLWSLERGYVGQWSCSKILKII